jgi:dTDP-4-dehydrorhamnose 3,5-epimerase
MEKIETGISGLLEIRPKVFADSRGWFMETYQESSYSELLEHQYPFEQDNLSSSSRGVLRGLHFQRPPFAQSKLVTVIRGKALDVAVDLRKSSPTFGKHFSILLDSTMMNQLFIPKGFAHGFLALEDNTFLLYKCDSEYHHDSECTLLWNDPVLAIDWKEQNPLISEKDSEGILWSDFNSPFD